MAGKKQTTYFSEEALAVLGDTADGHSGRVNQIIIRYGDAVKEARPEFSRPEWLAIFDALNGSIIDEFSLRLLWAEVSDADRLGGLGEKWGVDAQALAAKIRNLEYIGCCAVAEMTARFWQLAPMANDHALDALLLRDGRTLAQDVAHRAKDANEALNLAGEQVEGDQDWENEATRFTFADGSRLDVSGPGFKVL